MPEPDLRIRIKRHADGSASLTCIRRDGTSTWQRQSGQLGMVFPPHDLTHLAVESTLGYRQGFYGLIADGWEIADFAKPWARGPIPREAREVEIVVSMLESYGRRTARERDRLDLNAMAAEYVAATNAAKSAHAEPPRHLSPAECEGVIAARAALLDRWSALSAGESLELEFQRGPRR